MARDSLGNPILLEMFYLRDKRVGKNKKAILHPVYFPHHYFDRDRQFSADGLRSLPPRF